MPRKQFRVRWFEFGGIELLDRLLPEVPESDFRPGVERGSLGCKSSEDCRAYVNVWLHIFRYMECPDPPPFKM